ncbi:MAG TPA: hydroxyisourate hydrolase [Longimicrobiaceae bacterium]|jgi:5-hydroxyisourate hydrolase|nr:hydroxyisourate hydrolase [Longimicrobiaceae bacterium]
MSSLSTHVLDTATGLPAAGVHVVLERLDLSGPTALADERTDADGRVRALLPVGGLQAATYRLRFDTGEYFRRAGGEPFFPEVSIVFSVADAARHHHVPLLLSPYGYSTYRGS